MKVLSMDDSQQLLINDIDNHVSITFRLDYYYLNSIRFLLAINDGKLLEKKLNKIYDEFYKSLKDIDLLTLLTESYLDVSRQKFIDDVTDALTDIADKKYQYIVSLKENIFDCKLDGSDPAIALCYMLVMKKCNEKHLGPCESITSVLVISGKNPHIEPNKFFTIKKIY